MFRHSADIVGHEQSPLVGSDSQYGRIIETSETSLMSCPEINSWLAASEARDDGSAQVRICLKPNLQD